MTARMITIPIVMRCQNEPSPMWISPVSRDLMIRTPTTVRKIPALAAEEARPPDHHRGDGLQLPPVPRVGSGEVELRGVHHSRQAREEAPDDIIDDLVAFDLDARKPRDRAVPPDGVRVEAQPRPPQDEIDDEHADREDDPRPSQARPHCGEGLREDGHVLAGPDDQGDAFRDPHHPHGDDEGGDARRDDDRPVDQAGQRADAHADEDGKQDRHLAHQDRADEDSGHGHDGSHRQVQPARDEHDRGPARDDPEDRRVDDDVGIRGNLAERRRQDREHGQNDQERQELRHTRPSQYRLPPSYPCGHRYDPPQSRAPFPTVPRSLMRSRGLFRRWRRGGCLPRTPFPARTRRRWLPCGARSRGCPSGGPPGSRR